MENKFETQDVNLFKVLHDKGFIVLQSDMNDIKDAVAKDRLEYLERKNINYEQKGA